MFINLFNYCTAIHYHFMVCCPLLLVHVTVLVQHFAYLTCVPLLLAEVMPGSHSKGKGQTKGGKSYFRRGDWVCEVCDGHNYNKRTECYQCRSEKPEQVKGKGGKSGKGQGKSMRKPVVLSPAGPDDEEDEEDVEMMYHPSPQGSSPEESPYRSPTRSPTQSPGSSPGKGSFGSQSPTCYPTMPQSPLQFYHHPQTPQQGMQLGGVGMMPMAPTSAAVLLDSDPLFTDLSLTESEKAAAVQRQYVSELDMRLIGIDAEYMRVSREREALDSLVRKEKEAEMLLNDRVYHIRQGIQQRQLQQSQALLPPLDLSHDKGRSRDRSGHKRRSRSPRKRHHSSRSSGTAGRSRHASSSPARKKKSRDRSTDKSSGSKEKGKKRRKDDREPSLPPSRF